MSIQEVRTLVAYNDWANDRFLGALRTLSEEQLNRTLVSSFPTILATQAHVVGAEWIWLQRWQGTSPSTFPPWLLTPALPTLEQELARVRDHRLEFVSLLEDSDIQSPTSYTNLAGQSFSKMLGDLIRHTVNHSTYHRGQLTTMLRQVGATPPTSDFVAFLPNQS